MFHFKRFCIYFSIFIFVTKRVCVCDNLYPLLASYAYNFLCFREILNKNIKSAFKSATLALISFLIARIVFKLTCGTAQHIRIMS